MWRAAVALLPLVANVGVASGAPFGNGVNLQPSYYNNGDVNFGWDLMKQNSAIKTVRIEIEPDKAAQGKSWISEAHANGYTVVATYHKCTVLGTNSAAELQAAGEWWAAHYADLSSSGPVIVNMMNEWGDHNISPSDYAAAYNTAISLVRKVYSGPIILDCPGWGQETLTASKAVTSITDANIILSVHAYPGGWNQGHSHNLAASDLDDITNSGRQGMIGEFGSGSGSSDFAGIVRRAKSLGWPVIGWAWNGDGGSLNMVTPTWGQSPKSASFSPSSYFNTIYPLLAAGETEEENAPTVVV